MRFFFLVLDDATSTARLLVCYISAAIWQLLYISGSFSLTSHPYLDLFSFRSSVYNVVVPSFKSWYSIKLCPNQSSEANLKLCDFQIMLLRERPLGKWDRVPWKSLASYPRNVCNQTWEWKEEDILVLYFLFFRLYHILSWRLWDTQDYRVCLLPVCLVGLWGNL